MIWLISANSNIYDHSRSFSDSEYIDWKQGKTQYQIGDLVYIYVTRPEKKIRYKCVVEKINLNSIQIRNDKEYWVNQSDYEKSLSGYFFQLKLLARSNTDELGLDKLKSHGLSNAPQGPKKLSGDLLNYIENNFGISLDELIIDEAAQVEKSLAISESERRRRISKTPRKPNKIAVVTYVYERSSDIVAEALIRANGVCESCSSLAPFRRKKDNTPYLEVHHKKRLADGGEDTLENVIALCPNCHREKHYGF